MARDYNNNEEVFTGQCTFTGSGNPSLGANTVGNTQIKSSESGTLVDAEKLETRLALTGCKVATGTNVVTTNEIVHIAKYAGAVESFEAVADTVPTGSATVVVDLQKSTGGAAFSTVLTSTITINSSSTNRTAVAGTVNTATYSAGDLFKIIVTATTGTSDTAAQGFAATAFVHENGSSV